MTVLVFALVALAVLALLVLVHRWVWVRLVRDTTAPGGWARRVLTGCVVGLPLLSVAALVAGRAGAPFWVQRGVAWPGFMWLALLLYLVLALLVAEPLRLLLLRRAASGEVAGVEGGAPAGAVTDAPGGPLPASGGASNAGGARSGAPAGSLRASNAGGAEGGGAEGGADAGVRCASGGASNAGGAGSGGAEGGAAMGGGAVGDGGSGRARSASPAFEAPPEAASAHPAPQGSPQAGPADPGSGSGEAASGGVGPGGVGARPGSTRRVFVARVLAGAAAAAATTTVGYGTYGVLRGPKVKRVTVPLAKLPRAAHGFRIAVVSDVHLGPILGRAHTTRIVDAVNATQPDLIAIVGDLVDGSVHDLGSAAEPLARLRSRHGSFFVTGNHEYFSGAQQWVDHVRELGLHPLENARQELPYFDLAGVNDVAGESEGHGPDFDRALGGRDRDHRTAVLLAHQPIVIHDAVRHGVDLQLSGHTHGGQLWPGNYLAELANPTVAGLERYGDTQLYVSRGAGAWGPPVRVGAPSDITVVQLASYQT
ncbi:metallophosphoesterase [Streptomyces sp. NPDC098789]|uniref:metallophosphoesterase n=1 Tax=Streptomyces sp. NPDC098789 TaxID=3366098 RepID=UPI0037F10FA9